MESVSIPNLDLVYKMVILSTNNLSTMVENRKEHRCKYWATRWCVGSHCSLVRLIRTDCFARTLRWAHSFACSLTSLTPSLVGQSGVLIYHFVSDRNVTRVHPETKISWTKPLSLGQISLRFVLHTPKSVSTFSLPFLDL